MRKFNYHTKFIWEDRNTMRVFYQFQNGCYIPAGVDFTFHRQRYTTSNLIATLSNIQDADKFPKLSLPYWTGDVNKKFVDLYKALASQKQKIHSI